MVPRPSSYEGPCRTSLEVLLGQLQCQYMYLKGVQYYSFQKSSLTDLDPDIYMGLKTRLTLGTKIPLPLAWPRSAPSVNSVSSLHHSSLSHLDNSGPWERHPPLWVAQSCVPGLHLRRAHCFLVALEQACSPRWSQVSGWLACLKVPV